MYIITVIIILLIATLIILLFLLIRSRRQLTLLTSKNTDHTVKISKDEIQNPVNNITEVEKHYQWIYDSMNEGIALFEIIFDDSDNPIDYKILDFNLLFEVLFGINRLEAKNKLISEFHPNMPAPFLKEFTQVATTGVPSSFEIYYPPQDKHFKVAAFSPETNLFAILLSDITQIKKTQELLTKQNQQLEKANRELQESKTELLENIAYFESLFDAVDGEIYVCSENLNIEYANKRFSKRFGEAHINKKCHKIIYNNNEICNPCLLKTATIEEKIVSKEVYNDLDKRWDHIICSPIVHQDNNKSYIIILNNISQKKNSEKELYLKQFCVDQTSLPMFQIASSAQLYYANRAACDSLGYAYEELINLKVYDFDTRINENNWKENWNTLKQKKSGKVESVYKRKDGTTFPVLIYGNYFEYEGKSYNFAYAINLDQLQNDISDQLITYD